MNRNIKNLIKGSLEDVADRSLFNCHAKGLHSIVLDPNPKAMVRMFYTSPDHEMWRNDALLNETLSIAIHSHHCSLELVPVLGSFVNVTTELDPENGTLELNSYKWTSHINTGNGGFEANGSVKLKPLVSREYSRGLVASMEAYEFHTVYVEKGVEAAWLVFEGDEDPEYNSSSFSNDNLEKFSTDGFYLKMSVEDVERILGKL